MGKTRILSFLSISIGISISLFLPFKGIASDEKSSVGEMTNQLAIQTNDLGIANPGLLPTNPFYFLKEWKRSIVEAFTNDPVRRVDLEIDYLNERAAELKKLLAIKSRGGSIEDAVSSYEQNISELENRLADLKPLKGTSDVGLLLGKLTDASLKQAELFESLKSNYALDSSARSSIDKAEDDICGVIALTSQYFDDAGVFSSRLDDVLTSQISGSDLVVIVRELRFVSVLNRIQTGLSGDPYLEVGQIKDRLTADIESRLAKLSDDDRVLISDPEFLRQIPDEGRVMFQGAQSSPANTPATTINYINGLTCSSEYNPVCGENGRTYPNACYAGKDNVKIAYSGICAADKNPPIEPY